MPGRWGVSKAQHGGMSRTWISDKAGTTQPILGPLFLAVLGNGQGEMQSPCSLGKNPSLRLDHSPAALVASCILC